MNYSNNAFSVIVDAIASTDTIIALAAGTGSRFPESDFRATLVGYDANGNESAWEIVHCSSRSGDVLTVTRGQEGTSAAVWAGGARIENRITAGSMATLESAITPGTTVQYLRGDKTWRDFFTDVRAATLNGLSTATNAVVTAADTVLAAIGKLQAQVNAKVSSATLLGSGGAGLVGYTNSGTGAVAMTVQTKLRESASVKDFGAVGDGVTNDTSAVIAMKTAVGYVRFPAGVYLISSNITINTPIYFDDQASVSVGSGFTLTIAEAFINAPRQKIFSGEGSISLTGERTVSIMAEWFGVIPGNSAGDLAPNMNKLFAACPSARECLVSIGPGSFYFRTAPNAVPRAVRLVGSGERITNFVFMGSLSASGDFFTTGGDGVWIEGVQFTCTDGSSVRTGGSLIKLAHQYCKVRSVWFTDSFSGVDVSGNFCEVDGVVAFRNSSASGSYLVKLSSGFGGARVRNVQYNDSAVGLGPEYAVRVDGHSNFIIDSVTTAGAGTTVGIVPLSGTCSGGQVNNIRATGSTGVNGVVINSAGTGAVEKLFFGSIIADGLTGYGFKMQKDGSGIMKYIEIQHLEARACTLGGFKVDSSNGRPDHWHLKGGYCRNSPANGYEVANSQYWTITGCEAASNTGTGTLIANTCANFIYTSNRNVFNTASNLADNSGSVTKVLTNNI